jgi:hypothetical protein
VTDQKPRDDARPFVSLQSLNDDDALFDLIPEEGQLLLTAPSTVDMLLRHYTKFLMDHAIKYYVDRSLVDENVALMKAEAERLQGVFYGRDPAYKGTSWNRPEELGKFLVEKSGVEAAPEDAVAEVLRVYWDDLKGQLFNFYEGKLSQQMFVDVIVPDLIEMYSFSLRGLPIPPDWMDTGEED